MLSRRDLLAASLIVGASSRLTPRAPTVLASTATPAATADRDAAVLDGESPVDAVALADLARARAALAANWLAEAQRPTGVFYYIYNPNDDHYEITEYNEVRHAGTTYALFEAYGLLGDETVLGVAEKASNWIRRSTVPVRAAGRAFLDIQNGDTSLGGQSLALVALLERRRVTGRTDADGWIGDMATFLLWMEMDDHTGHFYNSYRPKLGRKSETPDVAYYPGEALLALTRLSEQFPDRGYLEVAERAADYVVHRRDGDIPSIGSVPREDHWLAIALSELYRLNRNRDYATVAYLQVDSMISHQFTAKDRKPDDIGGARPTSGPISYKSTATKGEAIVSAWGLATLMADKDRIERFSLGAQRNTQFQMRRQYTAASTGRFERPERAIGGWGANAGVN